MVKQVSTVLNGSAFLSNLRNASKGDVVSGTAGRTGKVEGKEGRGKMKIRAESG